MSAHVCNTRQYWKMDEGIYTKGLPPYGTKLSPDFCFGHWQTQCRATYEAPVDPHVVLGGFPNGPRFASFSADATSFVVTYPVDSSADNRCGQTLLLLVLATLDSSKHGSAAHPWLAVGGALAWLGVRAARAAECQVLRAVGFHGFAVSAGKA